MAGTWKRTTFTMVAATLALTMSATSAGAGPSRGSDLTVRIESASQKEILARGLEVRVSNKGAGRPIVRVSGSSSTFDVPHFTRLTKTRAFRPRGAKASAPSQRVTVVRLRLTAAGRKQIASCEARTLRVEAAGASDQAKLATRGDASRSRSISAVPIVATSSAKRTDRCVSFRSRRLLHSRRSLDPNRSPDRSQDRRDAAERHRQADRRRALQPQRRLQPRAGDRAPRAGLDNAAAFEKTDPVPIGRIGRYAEPNAPIVLIDAHTGERVPIFVEIDSNATAPESTALMIQPATNLASGHRYIVALRDLKDADGNTIRAPEGFRYYRDRLPTRRAPIKRRRAHFEGIFDTLHQAGIRRSTCTSPGTSPSPATRTSRRGC